MSQGKFRLAAVCCAAFILISGSGPLMAQADSVDDFNDGVFDGWTPFDVGADEAWGPGIVGINGKNELLLANRRPVPTNMDAGLLGASWDAGADDPRYSEGTLRARLRIEEASTNTGVIMRSTGSLDTGFDNYAFNVTPGPHGTEFCISQIESTTVKDDKCVLGTIPLGKDVFFEASAVGDQLSLKVWPVDDPIPAKPQVEWVDDRYTAGTLGVYALRADGQGDYFFESNFAAVFDDLTFTPASPIAPANAVPEPTSGWLTAWSCAILFSCRRRHRKNRVGLIRSFLPPPPTMGSRQVTDAASVPHPGSLFVPRGKGSGGLRSGRPRRQ